MTSSITAIRVTAHMTVPIIFDFFVLVISKFSVKKRGRVRLKKSRIAFPALPKDIFTNIPFRVRVSINLTNYNTFF